MDYAQHIQGLKNGSYTDFKILYKEFSGNLFGFVYSLTKSESITKDIVQETFIKVWLNRENIDPQMSFKSYLYKIAKNNIIDDFRKQINSPVFEDYMEYCDNPHLSNLENIELQLDLDTFIKQLNVVKEKLTLRQREIFELCKEQGLSSSEVAEKLNLSEQTVYNTLSLVMKILKKELSYSSFLSALFLTFFN